MVNLVNDKLQEIGSKLDVSGQDIKGIQKSHTLSKLKYSIATAVVGILALVIGFFAGRGSCPETIGSGGGYPFAGGLFALGGEKRVSKIAALMLMAIGFVVAIKTVPAFSQAILYNVYRMRK